MKNENNSYNNRKYQTNQYNNSNNRINANDTKHAIYIPESASDKLYNSIVRIETGNSTGTGFFIKILLNKKKQIFSFHMLSCYNKK